MQFGESIEVDCRCTSWFSTSFLEIWFFAISAPGFLFGCRLFPALCLCCSALPPCSGFCSSLSFNLKLLSIIYVNDCTSPANLSTSAISLMAEIVFITQHAISMKSNANAHGVLKDSSSSALTISIQLWDDAPLHICLMNSTISPLLTWNRSSKYSFMTVCTSACFMMTTNQLQTRLRNNLMPQPKLQYFLI